MRPRWMRNYISCPDCGHIFKRESSLEVYDYKKHFDCLNCQAHYTNEDFWDFQLEKAGFKPIELGNE